MKTPSKKHLLLSAISVSILAGCATDMPTSADRRGVSEHISGVEAQLDQDSNRLRRVDATGRPGNIKVNDGIYIGYQGFRTNHGDPLPRRFETANGVLLNTGPSINLPMFAQMLHKTTGIRVEINDLYANSVSGSDAGAAGSNADSTGSGEGAASVQNSFSSPSSTHSTDVMFYVDHSGPLSSLLDYVAGQVNADWEYTGGKIKFLGPQTVTYTVWAPGNKQSTSGSVGNDGNSFGVGQAMRTSISSDYDYWQGIENGLQAIMPDSGGRMSINKGSGTVTVTAFQSVHDRVADFVEQENARLSRQVAVKVDVLAISKSNEDNRSTNLNMMLENAAAGLNLSFLSPVNEITGSSGLGSTIIDTDSNFSGSSAMINALAKQGRVALLKSTSVIASNEMPTPVSIGTQKAYLAGSTTETDESGQESTSITTGNIVEGINLVLTPRIMSNGEMMMSYSMTLSDLKSMERYETPDMMIQLPEINAQSFAQTVNMGSGDSLVLAAFDSSRTSREGSGPFNPKLWGLGGADGFSVEDTKIVVIMTPVVVERNNRPMVRR